jgi:hypothetical protein
MAALDIIAAVTALLLLRPLLAAHHRKLVK